MHVPWITIDTPDPVRVGNGTVPLPIVVYIDGSFVKNRIAIYITVRNLSSAVTGKSIARRVLGNCGNASCFEEGAHCGAVECLARPEPATQIASCMHETCSGFSEQVLFC